MGHIVAKPELSKTKTGKSVSHFALATNNEWFDSEGVAQRSVDFHRIVAWEGLAQLCEKNLTKGSPVYVEGRLTNRCYESKDKSRRYITEVVADRINILSWKPKDKKVETKELANA